MFKSGIGEWAAVSLCMAPAWGNSDRHVAPPSTREPSPRKISGLGRVGIRRQGGLPNRGTRDDSRPGRGLLVVNRVAPAPSTKGGGDLCR